MTEARLAGQSALVTGGAGGFGLACAMLLARDGAAVTLMGRTEAKLEEAKAKIVAAYPEAKVQVCAGDAMSEAEVGAAMDLAASGPDRFGIVVATVGGSRSRGFVETELLFQALDEFRIKTLRAAIFRGDGIRTALTRRTLSRLAEPIASTSGKAVCCVDTSSCQLRNDALDRATGGKLNYDETDRHDSKHGRNHQKNSLEKIIGHRWTLVRWVGRPLTSI